MKRLKIIGIIVFGLLTLIVVVPQLVINSSVTTNIIDKAAAMHINGTLSYSKLKVSLWRYFPKVRIHIEDLTLTTNSVDTTSQTSAGTQFEVSAASPSSTQKEASAANQTAYSSQLEDSSANQTPADTLLYMREFNAMLRPLSLMKGKVLVDELNINKLRAFAEVSETGQANWNIIVPKENAKDSVTTESPINFIAIDSLRIDDSYLSYRSKPDTLDAQLYIESLHSIAAATIEPDSISIDKARLELIASSVAMLKNSASANTGIELKLSASGSYSPSCFPQVDMALSLPKAELDYLPYKLHLALQTAMEASLSKEAILDARIINLSASTKGLDISAKASAADLLGDDPRYKLDAGVNFILDTISRAIAPVAEGIDMTGKLALKVKADALQSEFDDFRFERSAIQAQLSSDKIDLAMPKDSIDAHLFSTLIDLESSNSGLSVKTAFDSVYFQQGVSLIARAREFLGSAKITKVQDDKDNFVPFLEFNSSGDRMFVKTGSNRVGAASMKLSLSARKRVRRTLSDARKKSLDSLAALYPEMSKSEIVLRSRRGGDFNAKLPDFLSEKDFEKADVQLSLDSSIVQYFRQWSPSGQLKLSRGFYASPLLPLRTRLNSFDASFDDKSFALNAFELSSGTSDLNVKGYVNGIGGVIRGKGLIETKINIKSHRLNLNEIVAATQLGKQDIGNVSVEDENDESFVTDTLVNAPMPFIMPPLLVVPANLIAELNLNVDTLDFAEVKMTPMSTTLRVRERTVQLADTKMFTNYGNANLDVFYSTKTKNDISLGLDLRLSQMPIHTLINSLPSVDKLMPLLKSFSGKVGCEISGTAKLDTLMNIIMPTVDGLVRVTGSELEIKDAGSIRGITRLLLFKNANIGHIEDLKIDAMIRDNMIELFPFELKVDRYNLALRGTQHLDGTLFYHLSVLRSPFLIPFGINVYGTLDNWRFSLGRAKFRDGSVPAYTKQLDTVQVNFAQSVHNIFRRGVDNVMRYNSNSLRSMELESPQGGGLMSVEDLGVIDDRLMMEEIREQEAALQAEVDAILKKSSLDSAKLLKQYQESIYDERMDRKIQRLKRQSKRRAKSK